MKRKIGILLSFALALICAFALADVKIDEEHFPNESFRDVIAVFDTNHDEGLSDAEIAVVNLIDVSGKNVADLKGIEYFTALKELNCKDNQLEALDLSGNTHLESLICSGNKLKDLDVSFLQDLDDINCASNQLTALKLNEKLTYLNCDGNQLEEINVQETTKLRNLICSNNQLEELDVSKNTLLLYLTCSDNKIADLNLGNNTKLRKLTCSHNRIVELVVRDASKLDSLVREKEPQQENGLLTWSADDDGDGKADRALTVDQTTRIRDSSYDVYGGMIEINEEHFPDENFRSLVTEFDTDNDGVLSNQEINNVDSLDCAGKSIRSLQGMEFFSIWSLHCEKNQLTSLDLRRNTGLEEVNCSYNQLTSLNIEGCRDLESLVCYSNKIRALDVSDSNSLCDAVISGRHTSKKYDYFLYSWEGDEDSGGSYLSVDANVRVIAGSIISEGVPSEEEIEDVNINETNFPDKHFREIVKEFDGNGDNVLSGAEIWQVREINCSEKSITTLQGIEYFTALKKLYCNSNALENLNLTQNKALTVVECNNNNLRSLDVNTCLSLSQLLCQKNNLTDLDISKCTTLEQMDCTNNRLGNLDISGNQNLVILCCDHNQMTKLDVSSSSALICAVEFGREHTTGYDYFPAVPSDDCEGYGADGALSCYLRVDATVTVIARDIVSEGTDTELPPASELANVNINAKNFPDKKFRKIVKEFDKDGDNTLSGEELLQIKSVTCSKKGIASLQGIEHFIALEELVCDQNELGTLDLSKNAVLYTLRCNDNKLTNLNISGCTKIKYLYCYKNALNNLDVSNNQVLTEILCYSNYLTGLNVSGNKELILLDCHNNKLTSLKMNGCKALGWLDCSKNQLKKLDVSKHPRLEGLECNSNKLTSLKVDNCWEMTELICNSNKFSELDLSNTILSNIIERDNRQHSSDGYDYFEGVDYEDEDFEDSDTLSIYIRFDQNVRVITSRFISEPLTDTVYTEDGIYKLDRTKKTARFISPRGEVGTSFNHRTLEISDTVKSDGVTYKVTEIADSACKGLPFLEVVTIGKNVKKIGKNAFSDVWLREVLGGDAVREIGESAFYNCGNLTIIECGKNVTTIGRYAFFRCTNIKKLSGWKDVETIGAYAFSECSKLTSLPSLSKLKSIESYAFSGTAIKNITIPLTVKKIGTYAFANCSKLQKIDGGENVKTIGSGAFRACKALQTFPSSSKLKIIGSKAFENCASLSQITLPAEVTTIGNSAFRNCSKLKTIVIKTTQLTSKNIGTNAFKDIYSKPTVTCPKSKLKEYKKLLPKKGMPKRAKYK